MELLEAFLNMLSSTWRKTFAHPRNVFMFTASHGRTFLGIALVLALLGLLDLAMDGLLYLGPYLLPCLIVLALLMRTMTLIARRRGWGVEGRIVRFLNRPRFLDESHRSG
jgi:hypothetical protein